MKGSGLLNMQHTLHVSAPSKLMLLGEHAVVHRHPCLVMAMNARLHMTLALNAPDDDTFRIHAPEVDGSIVLKGIRRGSAAGRLVTARVQRRNGFDLEAVVWPEAIDGGYLPSAPSKAGRSTREDGGPTD